MYKEMWSDGEVGLGMAGQYLVSSLTGRASCMDELMKKTTPGGTWNKNKKQNKNRWTYQDAQYLK